MSKLYDYVCLSSCGATCDEIEVSLGLLHQSASAEIRKLVLLGKLSDSGQRRRTRSGRTATVWRAAEISEATQSVGRPLEEASRALNRPIEGAWILAEWVLRYRVNDLDADERDRLCRWWAGTHPGGGAQ
jgi:hypothetical protein